ncbi:hypothetical protein [Dyadobacter sp.]|uniref:hypothetical protein n=1 Tax=Dyadobacter sp. TaxID=1914288 RepID=UPI003F72773A
MRKPFNDKLQDYFLNLNITINGDNKPSQHLTHLYADYVEVISLFSNNNYVSSTDVLDRFIDEGIIKKRKKNDEDQAESNDNHESWINQIFQVIVDRVHLYESDYPFETLDNNKIRLRNQHLFTNRSKLYLFLLLASNLNVFSEFEPELTSEFEMVSFEALKMFLPPHAVVKSFGKNSDYQGSAIQKIRSLASDLKVITDEQFIAMISERGNQERGLDLIGWIPYLDNVPNSFALLAQCACGKKWFSKLNESRRFEKYYKFHCNKPIHSMFIPYSLINYQNSEFYQADEFTVETLVFERKRILNFIVNDRFFDSYDSKLLVEKCLLFEEDVV